MRVSTGEGTDLWILEWRWIPTRRERIGQAVGKKIYACGVAVHVEQGCRTATTRKDIEAVNNTSRLVCFSRAEQSSCARKVFRLDTDVLSYISRLYSNIV